ncbi:MAG: peroxiredoxin 2/4 [Candidatus Woesearchaeota archaeon]|nr:peroxiredoxin 2/4 [Candidatus Woesearchaeota archaeon]MDN5327508.1 peroxiredoxin 2/4 [Candidatus Woesearchaeota archaeon]
MEGLPLLGDKFPEVVVKTTKGTKKLPEDYKGKWFVLFSHPADFTPVCTTEFYAFQQRFDKFKELNAELIGLSIDQVFSHMKWIEWIKENLNESIEFPVIADDTGALAKTLGMISENKGTNTVRAVFIVDPKGIIRLIMYYPPEVGRDVDEILRALKALQVSDKEGVAMPHKWPNNELIGNKVILPPPANEEEKEKRLELLKNNKIEGYDWWLSFKELKE